MFKKFFIYLFLLLVIFFSLVFITGQNEQYQKLDKLESSLVKNLYTQVVSYKENLYSIEKEKIKSNVLNPNIKLNLLYVSGVN